MFIKNRKEINVNVKIAFFTELSYFVECLVPLQV